MPIKHSKVVSSNNKADDSDWNADHDVVGLLGWELVESKTVNDVASITFSDLDGNTDEEYKVIAELSQAAVATPELAMRINNDSGSNYRNTRYYQETTGVNSEDGTTAYARMGVIGATSVAYHTLKLYIKAKTSWRRYFSGECFTHNGSTTQRNYRHWGYWLNVADNITSLVFYANSNLTGTIKLYKKLVTS